MDATQQHDAQDNDSTLEELQRQLEQMRKEIDEHNKRRKKTRGNRRRTTREIVYCAVAEAKKGKPAV